MNLPSVIVSLVLFAICLPTMLAGYSRATATIWDAKAEQQAVAVAAWHAARVSEVGCDSSYPDTGIRDLVAGDKFLPHDGFSVSCDDTPQIAWPPPVTPTYPPTATTVPVPVLSVTTEWNKLNGTGRSVSLTVLKTTP